MNTIGRFRDRVEFQSQTTTDDGYGNLLGVWSTFLTVWGDLRETKGGESREAGAVESTPEAELRVRQNSLTATIGDDHRVRARGQLWEILSIVQPGHVPDVWLIRVSRKHYG